MDRSKTNVVYVRGDARVHRGLEALGYRIHVVTPPAAAGGCDREVAERVAAAGTQLEQLHPGSTSVFVGAAGDAALTHAAALVEARGRGAVLVCPVLRPGEEASPLAALWERAPAGSSRRGVAYGTCDERAAAWPSSAPAAWEGRTTAVGVYAGHELCRSVDVRLLDHLIQSTSTRR